MQTMQLGKAPAQKKTALKSKYILSVWCNQHIFYTNHSISMKLFRLFLLLFYSFFAPVSAISLFDCMSASGYKSIPLNTLILHNELCNFPSHHYLLRWINNANWERCPGHSKACRSQLNSRRELQSCWYKEPQAGRPEWKAWWQKSLLIGQPHPSGLCSATVRMSQRRGTIFLTGKEPDSQSLGQ